MYAIGNKVRFANPHVSQEKGYTSRFIGKVGAVRQVCDVTGKVLVYFNDYDALWLRPNRLERIHGEENK